MAGYVGNIPVPQGTQTRQQFTATANQTSFPTIGYTDGFFDCHLNGVKLLAGVDFNVGGGNGSDVILATGASANDILEVTIFDTFTTSSATFTGTTTFADGGNIITATAGTDNVRLGENAGNSIISGGNYNVTIGKDAGTAITTGDGNVAVGFEALKTEDANGKNIAIGYQALKTLDVGSDGFNTVIGYQAGTSMNTGTVNTLIGHQAGDALTTGNNNVAVGHEALGAEIQGDKNVAIGVGALQSQSNSSDTDANNVAVGYNAGLAMTTGVNNTAVGSFALTANTIGNSNVAIGNDAMDSNTEGEKCTAVGVDALQANTTGDFNTAVGWSALQAVTTGDQNVAVGAYAAYNNEGEYNTVVGHEAYIAGVSGDYNSCFGYKAGENISTSSDKNTCIGAFAGSNMTSSATNNVMLGYDTATSAANDDYQIIIGTQMNGVGPEYVTIGNNSRGRIYNLFSSNATWTRTSDERIKKDIETNTDCGLDFINDLRTVTYKWKAPSEHPEEFLSYDKDITEASYTEKMYGFIAQEVKAAMDTHNITGFNGWHVTPESQGSQQGVSYEMFVMPLVKAVQELSAEVETLKTKVAALEAE